MRYNIYFLSLGSICNITFLRVGCFFDHQLSPRPLPELILTDRDPDDPHNSGNKSVDWENWNAYHKVLVCRCAKRAKETKNVLFATQFYGKLENEFCKLRNVADLELIAFLLGPGITIKHCWSRIWDLLVKQNIWPFGHVQNIAPPAFFACVLQKMFSNIFKNITPKCLLI